MTEKKRPSRTLDEEGAKRPLPEAEKVDGAKGLKRLEDLTKKVLRSPPQKPPYSPG